MARRLMASSWPPTAACCIASQVIFLAPTIPLVTQQASFLEKVGLKSEKYCGNDPIADWGQVWFDCQIDATSSTDCLFPICRPNRLCISQVLANGTVDWM